MIDIQLGDMEVEVVDVVSQYADMLSNLFDFKAIKNLLQRPDFSMIFDAMHGVAGPFATEIFCRRLAAPAEAVINGIPKTDFGGGHPDPNLVYAKSLVERMGLGANAESMDKTPDFGAAADGDADRNMVAGSKFFVTPSDSLAVIAAHAKLAIPQFKDGLSGLARSMPTSGAVDNVAKQLGIPLYEVPTGWKFFGNLMDAGKISICGEESFGTGSDHIREKDGIWAVLAWLSILAYHNPDPSLPLVTVEDIVKRHWSTYGRSYYTRYDYENVDKDKADAMIDHMRQSLDELKDNHDLKLADDFEYKDPVDNSVASKQGVRLVFKDNSRVIFRLSGTGSEGATIRMYVEACAPAEEAAEGRPASEALAPLVDAGLKMSKLQEFTGRTEPTVIT
mmetsp:Transcript_8735/g.16537  ORF Transcript_8735/g.16537 Transcript_8735/m.16537 type:complete len:392 (+) Transcript_8735:33-1208(+)